MKGEKHTPQHDRWDAGGYCNELVVDDEGYGAVCGYTTPRTGTPNLFEIIGYSAEVSEPNGPVVHGYFSDSWGRRAQAAFGEWFEQYTGRGRVQE